MRTFFVFLVASLSAFAQNSCPKGLVKWEPLVVKGDFDGDGKPDEIRTHIFSKTENAELLCVADFFEMEFDSVFDWFSKHDAEVSLTLNGANKLSLNTGYSQGLYCLLNLGDVDKNGGDEIALVIDFLDYSNVNSCRVYSFCSGKWLLRQNFSVHEDAFTWDANAPRPDFDQIRGFLEKRKGMWKFSDYIESDLTLDMPYSRMRPLSMKPCK